MKLRYERGALADLDEIFAYIAADSREAAGRLVARIERVATRIAASPHIGGTTRKSGFLAIAAMAAFFVGGSLPLVWFAANLNSARLAVEARSPLQLERNRAC
jgi:plasmid stabilization system protein ParE